MSMIQLQLPRSLHEKARELAAKENISLEHLISLALAEKISALMTEEILEERARRGSKDKLAKILEKVPDAEPEERDRI